MGFFDGKVRDRDPETSWDAAARQTDNKASMLRGSIRVLLGRRHMTDEELVDAYSDYIADRPWLPRVTPQNIRTRRNELKVAGQIRDTGERRLTRSGSTGRVWALAPRGDAGQDAA